MLVTRKHTRDKRTFAQLQYYDKEMKSSLITANNKIRSYAMEVSKPMFEAYQYEHTYLFYNAPTED